ncbi:MAG: extracellular solute-binding protein [Caldilineaceae bacterium]|nr:extracellular solute-binding protein [Caldilineaceae bacterium]
MNTVGRTRKLSRRAFLAAAGTTGVGLALAACATPGAAPAPASGGGDAAAPAGEKTVVRAQMVQKQDVSDWIQMGLDQDIDGFVSSNPDIQIELETTPGWTAEYVPKILSAAAAGDLGDAVWFPPRHRSHIAWGASYDIVTDLRPLAEGAGYDIDANFFEGAVKANSDEGKTYWMSYISEPIVPVIAYNKSKAEEMGIGEPGDDWTFDQLAEWAQAGTTADTFGYYNADRNYLAFSGAPYLRQHGVEPVSEDGTKVTLLDNADAFIAALQYDYDLTNTLKVSPSPSAGAINAPELFGGQKVLAVDIWPFRIQIYPATFTDFEIGFALTPVVNAGDARRSMLNEHVFGITTASQNPDAAFKFLTWIAGKEMNVQALIQGQKGPIARADVWADDRIYESVPTYAKLRPIMESIEADYRVANYRGEEFDNAFQAVYDRLSLGEIQAEEAANSIAADCQAVLDKEPA